MEGEKERTHEYSHADFCGDWPSPEQGLDQPLRRGARDARGSLPAGRRVPGGDVPRLHARGLLEAGLPRHSSRTEGPAYRVEEAVDGLHTPGLEERPGN